MPISEDIGDHVKGSTITPRSLHGPRRELIDILRFDIRQANLDK
jgi:hypothetical protein